MAFLYHVRLAELDADFHFHKPLHNGSIVLETGIRRYLDADTRLSHSELLALTLNEIAMTRGHGMVYWVPDIHQMSEGGAKTLKLGATPDLLYEDRAWTEDEMAVYRTRDHDERWVACAPSERNKLYLSTPVIPIRLVVHETEDTTALPSADICSVMLYYRKGEAYLAWMKDWMIKGSSNDFLKNHRKRDNEQVMDQFREMAGRKAEGDLVPWKDIAALIVSKDSDE